MVSLLDIADQQKTVPIRGKDIPVYGISADGVAHLLGAFPELRQLMAGGSKAGEITVDQIMKVAPRAVAAAIATGTGSLGDPKAESVASKLPIGEQVELLSTIFDLTFPQGIDPFLARLEALGLVRGPAVAYGKAPAMPSPAPSKD
jgi:hypothetical protein